MNVSDISPIDKDKARLRKRAKSGRAKLGIDNRAKYSRQIAQNFLSHVLPDPSGTIALYWPIGDEVDCRGLILSLRERGVQVALPTIVACDKPLVFRLFTGEEKLVSAPYGTKEPDMCSPIATPDIIALPLLAFDKTGARLGYGGGYYDRTIAGMKVVPTLAGLAFDAQELDFVPVSAHDMGLDMIITETGMRRFNQKGPKQ